MVHSITEVTYRIRQGPRCKTKVVHVDRLWRYYGPGHYTWSDEVGGVGPRVPVGEEELEPHREDPQDLHRDEDGANGRPETDDLVEALTSTDVDEMDEDLGRPPQARSPRPRRLVRRPRRFDDYELEGEEF